MVRFKALIYTIRHKIAFLKVEKQLLGKNTLRGYMHDLDKVILYPILGKNLTHKIHRKFARHHFENAITESDYIQMIIDWECARFTKPDKPLNAYDFMMKTYPKAKWYLEPIMKRLGII